MNPRFYTTPEVCRAARITYRQLDYWCSGGLVAPVARTVSNHTPRSTLAFSGDLANPGAGTARLFDEAGLTRVRAAAALVRLGIALPTVRRILAGDAAAGIRAFGLHLLDLSDSLLPVAPEGAA